MKRISFCILFAIICLFLGSCTRTITSVFFSPKEIKEKHVIEAYSDSLNRSVILIGMVHVGKPGYYESVKNKLDSLREDGYVFFYEGVGYPPDTDSLTVDTMSRKLRKLIGFHLTHYLDKENKSRRPYNTKKYVHQTLDIIGLSHESDDCIHADLFTPELIRRYERDKGEIVLTEYDWQTPLLEKYKPRKSGDKTEYDMRYATRNLRDKHLFETIVNSDHDKIAVIYGWGHSWKIYVQLRDSLGYKADFSK